MAIINEFASVFQSELDRQIIEGSTSGWMEENAGQVIYRGGKTIKMPSLTTKGLADYDRENGYIDGALSLTYDTFTLSKDRGRRFRLDAMDVDESAFAVTAAKVAEEFQRTKVIPEIDAYRYSSIASKSGIHLSEESPTTDDVFESLSSQIGYVLDLIGGEDQLVVSISRSVYNSLIASDKMLAVSENSSLKQGEIDLNVKILNGALLIPVPSARMFTAFSFNPSGDGGFSPTGDPINWIITPRSVPIAVSKTDNIKIVPPDQNQFADAWDIDYRKYHDLFIPSSKVGTISVSVNTST
jgi:hypothetical protein